MLVDVKSDVQDIRQDPDVPVFDQFLRQHPLSNQAKNGRRCVPVGNVRVREPMKTPTENESGDDEDRGERPSGGDGGLRDRELRLLLTSVQPELPSPESEPDVDDL